MIPQEFEKFKSYSSYGSSYKDEYNLTDKYFSKVVDGCLICSDTQETIDIMGNVCLVHPELGVLHLESIPRPEYDGEIRFSFDANDNLIISCKCYAANGRKHGYWEDICINTHFNDSMRNQLLKKHLVLELNSKVKSRQGGSIRTNFRCYGTSETTLRLVVDYKEYGYGYKLISEDCFSQDIVLTNRGFSLNLDKNGDDSVLNYVNKSDVLKILYEFNVKHKLQNPTSFILVSKFDDKYGVKDEEDGITEYYSKEELVEIVLNGISIRGVDILPNKCIKFRT